ncbi:Gfo/Idh/MocA family protein [Shouchella shacheensis]|uniref:Gfo/Idh/MocA family protein n=1 Tax=Shouchella shacheensis TaxID=1649580 RepID=UPI0007404200|nr:Gfo/Idh/MocA family oxidoreductase [Shouchella shacheensis]
MEPIKVGIIGCGNISSIYLENASRFSSFSIEAVADINRGRAEQQAEKYGIDRVLSVEELIRDEEIELVLNLTIPAVHAEIALAALSAGKHVYGEKPLAITLDEGKQILELAKAKGLLVGNAPDTFLGGAHQTARSIIEAGRIGTPISATAFMMNHGHEHWHPDPHFYYQEGAGPMFDMGPYYLTALVNMMGPAKRVTGSTGMAYQERRISSQPLAGESIIVKTPTQINGIIDFTSGAVASIITSFDTWHHRLPHIEIYGTEGSLSVPDPNQFGGDVFVRGEKDEEWNFVPSQYGHTDNSRGVGLADMAAAILEGRTPRASGDLSYHVLEMMHGFHYASERGEHYKMTSSCTKPQISLREETSSTGLEGDK